MEEVDAEVGERLRFGGQRLAQLTVGSDREPGEPADLVALVVHLDRVPARGELAGADEARRPGADHGDAIAVRPHARPNGRRRSSARSTA